MRGYASADPFRLQYPEKCSTGSASAHEGINRQPCAEKHCLQERRKIVASWSGPFAPQAGISVPVPSATHPAQRGPFCRNVLEHQGIFRPGHADSSKKEPSEEHGVLPSRHAEIFRKGLVAQKSDSIEIEQAVAGAVHVGLAVPSTFPDRPEAFKFFWHQTAGAEHGLDRSAHSPRFRNLLRCEESLQPIPGRPFVVVEHCNRGGAHPARCSNGRIAGSRNSRAPLDDIFDRCFGRSPELHDQRIDGGIFAVIIDDHKTG